MGWGVGLKPPVPDTQAAELPCLNQWASDIHWRWREEDQEGAIQARRRAEKCYLTVRVYGLSPKSAQRRSSEKFIAEFKRRNPIVKRSFDYQKDKIHGDIRNNLRSEEVNEPFNFEKENLIKIGLMILGVSALAFLVSQEEIQGLAKRLNESIRQSLSNIAKTLGESLSLPDSK